MIRKYLKNREDYVKEHMNTLSEDETKDIKNIEASHSDNDENIESEDDEESNDDKKIEVEIEVEVEAPNCDGTKPVDITTDTVSTGFNPSNFNSNNFKQEWCVIKCMSSNGVRVGIDKQCDTDCEVICGNLSYNDACIKVEDAAKQCGCPVFNDECDEYVGRVSKAYIKKTTSTASPTSYKPLGSI